jgi:hypothetical protein
MFISNTYLVSYKTALSSCFPNLLPKPQSSFLPTTHLTHHAPTTSGVHFSLHYGSSISSVSTSYRPSHPTPYLGTSGHSIHASCTPEWFRSNRLRRHLRYCLFPRCAVYVLTSLPQPAQSSKRFSLRSLVALPGSQAVGPLAHSPLSS